MVEATISINQVNYIEHLCPILRFSLQLLFICILERKPRSIRDAQLFSFLDISQRCVSDEEVLDVSFPTDVLVQGGMVEHASQTEDESLCLCLWGF